MMNLPGLHSEWFFCLNDRCKVKISEPRNHLCYFKLDTGKWFTLPMWREKLPLCLGLQKFQEANSNGKSNKDHGIKRSQRKKCLSLSGAWVGMMGLSWPIQPIQPATYTLYSDPKTFVSNVAFVSFASDIAILLLSLCCRQYSNSSWMSNNIQMLPQAGYKFNCPLNTIALATIRSGTFNTNVSLK